MDADADDGLSDVGGATAHGLPHLGGAPRTGRPRSPAAL